MPKPYPSRIRYPDSAVSLVGRWEPGDGSDQRQLRSDHSFMMWLKGQSKSLNNATQKNPGRERVGVVSGPLGGLDYETGLAAMEVRDGKRNNSIGVVSIEQVNGVNGGVGHQLRCLSAPIVVLDQVPRDDSADTVYRQ